MSHETGHSKGKIAAELGVAGFGLAAAGAAGYLMYRKRKLEMQRQLLESDGKQYLEQLQILGNEKVDRLVPHGRKLMSSVAVRIYYATTNSIEQAVTKQSLLQQLGETDDEALHPTPHQLQKALGFLSDHKLIARRPHESNRHAQGYYAAPALVWAMEFGEKPDELAEAEAEFIAETF